MLKTIKQPRVIYIQLLIKKDEMIYTIIHDPWPKSNKSTYRNNHYRHCRLNMNFQWDLNMRFGGTISLVFLDLIGFFGFISDFNTKK